MTTTEQEARQLAYIGSAVEELTRLMSARDWSAAQGACLVIRTELRNIELQEKQERDEESYRGGMEAGSKGARHANG